MSVNEKMTAIADAIRDKTKGTEPLTLDGMATEIQKVFEEGKATERDEFWGGLQDYGNEIGRNYYYFFAYTRFTDALYNPEYPIICSEVANGGQNVFYNTCLTDTKVPIYANSLNIGGMFYRARQMKYIRGLVLKESTTFANAFTECNNLEKLIVSGIIGQNGFNVQWSTKLTHDSLMSIINALEDKTADTSGTEWIVTLGDENKAKLTDSELAIAENRGWTVK
ncbi:MAG: hypothetical protein Q4G23_03915 [Clostridia bacterium]|nr:hypothetical protein [Clostridia bacterium]